jgi:SAM-dependent methyltransferase
MDQQTYVGTELDTFAHAQHWKAYLRALMRPWLRGLVLEVGAGIGATTAAFRDGAQTRWTALEPDADLAGRLRGRIGELPAPVDVVVGTLSSATFDEPYDCVLYVDVLEHIEQDADELQRAAGLLSRRGAIIVLSPAHQALYTAFDRAIGHYRRYDAAGLRRLTPSGASLVHLTYVDSAGLLLSATNRVLLRSATPSVRQVQTWDRWFVPISRRLDRLLGGRVGKSILAVWQRSDET